MKQLFKKPIVFVCVLLFSLAFGISMQETTVSQETETNNVSKDFFSRPDQQKLWKILSVGKEGILMVDSGDVVVSKDTPTVFKFGTAVIIVKPGSVLRIHEVKTEDSKEGIPIPEILFGEVLFIGEDKELVLLPGHSAVLTGCANLTVDSERYSFIESFSGEQIDSPIGMEEEYSIPAGSYLEMGSAGEVGELQPVDEDYMAKYLEIEPEEDAVSLAINKKPEPIALEPYFEFWSEERVDLLQEGEESPEGLAIASGANLEQAEETTTESVQAFDQSTVKQKSLTFSASVDVTQDAASIPVISNLTIGGKKAENGAVINLAFKDLEDKSFSIVGKAVSSDPAGFWKLLINIGEDEISVDSIDSFTTGYKVTQDFANAPSVFDVTIAERSADMFQGEFNLVTRDDLNSGKLEITGSSEAGNNQLSYNIEIMAVDKDDNSHSIGKYTVEVDLSEIETVEVSIDDGMSWEPSSGKTSWNYQIRPSDGEEYKVKVRAVDVMGNTSDEQFEAWAFKYSYQTPKEILKDVFEAQMTALSDKDSNTFMRSVSQEFNSNIKDLRDYNELEAAIENRFLKGDVNVRYTINDISAYMDTSQGTVDFYWTSSSGISSGSYYEVYYYIYEDGKWLLREVTDPNTFLLLSKNPYQIDITLEESTLNADGQDSTALSALILDNSGTIVADDVEVSFSATDGSFSPETDLTVDGKVSTTYTAGTTAGTITITVTSGDAKSTAEITQLSRVPFSVEITIDDSTLYAGGEDTTTIMSMVYDKQGDAVADGEEVTFSATDGTLSTTTGQTVNGEASTTYTSGATEGTVTITVASGNAQNTASISLLSREPFSLDISADSSNLNADGLDSTTVRVTVYDKQGDPVADGEQVTFSATDGTISPTTGLTANGDVTATYTASTTDGTVTITATSGDAQSNTNITIDPLAAPLPPE